MTNAKRVSSQSYEHAVLSAVLSDARLDEASILKVANILATREEETNKAKITAYLSDLSVALQATIGASTASLMDLPESSFVL